MTGSTQKDRFYRYGTVFLSLLFAAAFVLIGWFLISSGIAALRTALSLLTDESSVLYETVSRDDGIIFSHKAVSVSLPAVPAWALFCVGLLRFFSPGTVRTREKGLSTFSKEKRGFKRKTEVFKGFRRLNRPNIGIFPKFYGFFRNFGIFLSKTIAF